jgi:diguanylate cyclase (GGDEF)-like protein
MIYSSWKWVVLLPLLTKPVSFVLFGGVVSSLIIFPLLYSQDVQEWKGNINNIQNMGSFYDSDNLQGDISAGNYIRNPSQYTEVQVKTLLFSKSGNPQECNAKIREFLTSVKKIQPHNIPVVLNKVCANRGFAIGRFADENTIISILPLHDKGYSLVGVKIRKYSILGKPAFSKSIMNFSNVWPALIIIILSMVISYLLSLIAGGYLRVLNEYASKDGLTGCLRREAFYAKASYELEKSKKNNVPFSVLVIDLDHLRDVNNTYGHAKGDTAISLIAETILKSLRGTDFVGRVGGDEFIVILKDPTPADALLIANRIRHSVKSLKLDDLSLSVSIGISQCEKQNATLQEIISKADTNLYLAKRQRNEVVFENDILR